MTHDQIARWTRKRRMELSKDGCWDCSRILAQGLFIKRDVGLNEMVRTGAQQEELEEAMQEGLYCRTCLNKHRRFGLSEPIAVAAVAAATSEERVPPGYLEMVERLEKEAEERLRHPPKGIVR